MSRDVEGRADKAQAGALHEHDLRCGQLHSKEGGGRLRALKGKETAPGRERFMNMTCGVGNCIQRRAGGV